MILMIEMGIFSIANLIISLSYYILLKVFSVFKKMAVVDLLLLMLMQILSIRLVSGRIVEYPVLKVNCSFLIFPWKFICKK